MQITLRAMATNGDLTPEGFRAAYDKHNAHVQSIVPKENLLLWGPQDGWDPLCKFLGVPVPEIPLPYINETATFKENLGGLFARDLKAVVRMGLVGLAGALVLVAGAIQVERQLGLGEMVRSYLPTV